MRCRPSNNKVRDDDKNQVHWLPEVLTDTNRYMPCFPCTVYVV
jgi:hypothetical protein